MIFGECRSTNPFSNSFAGPYHYETYAPLRESITFINNCECVYVQYSIYDRETVRTIDTCNWSYRTDIYNGVIILQNKNAKDLKNVPPKSFEVEELDFLYDICPKCYNITDNEFKKYSGYKEPLYQEKISGQSRVPSFREKYDTNYTISCDTIVIVDSCLVLPKQRNKKVAPSFFLQKKGKTKSITKPFARFVSKEEKKFYSWICNSYEYLNYRINNDRKEKVVKDSLIGKQFSHVGEAYRQEFIRFINDSICVNNISKKIFYPSMNIPDTYDTCHYTIKNNLLAINFTYNDGKPCDTLTYCDGVLFYSKVYKDSENKMYTHIVKPFIDEARSCANKADSINMIMSAYLSVYVPLNLYK